MRERSTQINFRVTKTEKETIRRKAKRCGMAVGEYVRNCALDRKVVELPREGLKEAYRRVGIVLRYLEQFTDTTEYVNSLKETLDIMLDIYYGKEAMPDGGDEDMADQG